MVASNEPTAAGASARAVLDHAGSAIGPACPSVVVAVAPVKLALPKLAKGSVWQPLSSHADGASTIQSAAVTSSCLGRSCLAKWVPRVRLAR